METSYFEDKIKTVMNIVIDKGKVFKSVEMSVSIIARNVNDTNGSSLYDKLRIQERDKDMLDLYWNSTFGVLLNELGDFVQSHTSDTITLHDDRRFNESVISDLSEVIHSYLTDSITSEWIKIKAVEYASVFTEKASYGLSSIFDKLRKKTEPVLRKYGEPGI